MTDNVIPLNRASLAMRICDGLDDMQLTKLAERGGIKWVTEGIDPKRAINCCLLAEGVPDLMIEELLKSGGLPRLLDFQMKQLQAMTITELFQRIQLADQERRRILDQMFKSVRQIMDELGRALRQ